MDSNMLSNVSEDLGVLTMLFVCITSAIVDLDGKCKPLTGLFCWPNYCSHFWFGVFKMVKGGNIPIYYLWMQYIFMIPVFKMRNMILKTSR